MIPQGRAFLGVRQLFGPGRCGHLAFPGLCLRGDVADNALVVGLHAVVSAGQPGVLGGNPTGGWLEDGECCKSYMAPYI